MSLHPPGMAKHQHILHEGQTARGVVDHSIAFNFTVPGRQFAKWSAFSEDCPEQGSSLPGYECLWRYRGIHLRSGCTRSILICCAVTGTGTRGRCLSSSCIMTETCLLREYATPAQGLSAGCLAGYREGKALHGARGRALLLRASAWATLDRTISPDPHPASQKKEQLLYRMPSQMMS